MTLQTRHVRVLAGLVVAVALSSAAAAQQSQGIQTPIVLPPYDAGAAACTPPVGLAKSLGFARDNDRDFMAGVGAGLSAAAADRGLAYEAVSADSDRGKQAEQVRDFVARKF